MDNVVGMGQVIRQESVEGCEFVGILCWDGDVPFGVISVTTPDGNFSNRKDFADKQSAIDGLNELIDELIKSID